MMIRPQDHTTYLLTCGRQLDVLIAARPSARTLPPSCVIARKDTAIAMMGHDSGPARPLVRTQDWRAIAHNLLNRPTSSKGAFLLQLGTFGLILLSTLFFVLESLPDVQWGGWGVLDGLIAVTFTAELVLRFVVVTIAALCGCFEKDLEWIGHIGLK